MKSHLIVTPTANMDKMEWLRFRKRGIGASEVGTVMGLNTYKSALELFYEKLKPMPEMTIENIHQFMGHYSEDYIADLWQYWEGSQESVIANYRAGKVVRRCRKSNAYVNNSKYPWLFVSLDRIINKGELGKEGALEIKKISGYEAKKWIANIPTYYLFQLQDQILVCEFDYGELAVLQDGTYFDVYQFERNEVITSAIIERTKDFWYRIEKARMIETQRYHALQNFNMKLAEELLHELHLIEPEPDGTEACERYLKERYRTSMAEVGLITGTEEDYGFAERYKAASDKINELEAERRLCANHLKMRIREGRKIDFGKRGYVQWTGEPRRLLVKTK